MHQHLPLQPQMQIEAVQTEDFCAQSLGSVYSYIDVAVPRCGQQADESLTAELHSAR